MINIVNSRYIYIPADFRCTLMAAKCLGEVCPTYTHGTGCKPAIAIHFPYIKFMFWPYNVDSRNEDAENYHKNQSYLNIICKPVI